MNLLIHFVLASAALSAATAPDQAVESGREALDHLWRYPWYDSDSDDLRRIDVEQPYSWDWLEEWTGDWGDGWNVNWSPGGTGFGWPTDLLGWIAWIAIFALFGVLVWLLYRAFRRWDGRPDDAEDASGDADQEEEKKRRIEALPFPVRRPQGDLLEAAREARAQGNYGEAIVYLFSHQLVQLDQHHLIELAKGKTNRQYLREVGRRAAIRELLRQTMLAFEDVFFGHRAIDPMRFNRCWASVERFQTLVAEAGS